MADIFIAYARKDGAQVAPIAHALEAQGWSVWWDPHGAAGEILETMVERELHEAGCVVVVWSSSSVESDWVLGEADEGRERRILVPVVVDEQRPPIRFRRFNTVSLADWDGERAGAAYLTLVEGVRRILGEPTLSPADSQQADGETSAEGSGPTVGEILPPEAAAEVPAKDCRQEQSPEPRETRHTPPVARRRAVSWKAPALAVVVLAGVVTVSYLAYERRLAAVEQAHEEARRAVERDQRVEELMTDAEKAFADGRLITPPGDHALGLYREVLKIEQGYAPAMRGLERIAEHFIESARKRMEQQNWKTARVNLYRAERAGVLEEDIASSWLELKRREADANARRPESPQTQVAAEYAVCRGDDLSRCPQGAVHLSCGQSVAKWARSTCSEFGTRIISQSAGGRCGHTVAMITCSSPLPSGAE